MEKDRADTVLHSAEKLAEAHVRMLTAAAAIRDAHSVAVASDPVLAHVLLPLVGQVREISAELRALLALVNKGRAGDVR